ncbi:Putative auto-transporter adhesin, head GIN domain [Gillisia sp. Hel1_33_143]|uniref:head GIN domain-containing protein n=1 Tax=Gillisia sp. Hel1_33_143 TaxID=1336796 RepID=UPI00087AB1A3|nr:head GIN domain-containing protein [Gillisia sp. Hel1_33_143]SDS75305.1 Putative auto-transporter adhesin, head GIN domain [Gillisia sp. Hel1_33_143]
MKKSIFNQNKMLITLIISLLSFGISNAQSETVDVSNFSEVTISPYIEVIFKQADNESVIIENSKVDREKIHIEVDGKELHIYLEDAKIVSKEEEVKVNGREMDRSIYNGTEVRITVNYKNLEAVEIRSEEVINFENAISVEDFDLDIYGSPKVYFESISAEDLKIALYGESYLEIKAGKVDFQRYRCYGKSEVNAVELLSSETKIAAYGNNHIVVNVSDKLKVSAFGEARIQYKGDAKVKSGLKIGETVVQKIK